MTIWIPIPGYELLYEISDEGHVRSILAARYTLLAQAPNPGGYMTVHLSKPGKKSNILVHRLVLLAFIGPCPEGHEGGHLNGNRTDNRAINLQWITRLENHAHIDLHGTRARGDRHGMRIHKGLVAGERNGNATVTAADVIEIRRLAAQGVKQLDLANLFGLKEPAVWKIVNRRTWKHIEDGAIADRAMVAA